ncbi:hypothetical protein KCP78_17475 [Salmonella enterica subsp. enterica]|nr:hypothetical protein KCP78_17475 [Salmonella enterica subsp. enterica]
MAMGRATSASRQSSYSTNRLLTRTLLSRAQMRSELQTFASSSSYHLALCYSRSGRGDTAGPAGDGDE